MKKAVVIVSYDRTEYFRQTLESWLTVRGKENYTFFFSLDYSEKTGQMLDVINWFQTTSGVSIDVEVNIPKLGVGFNHQRAIQKAFDKENAIVIVAEDDVIVSNDILEYYEYAFGNLYESDILMICGHSHDDPGKSDNIIFKRQYYNPLSWAISKDKWDTVLKDEWSVEPFELEEGLIVEGFDFTIDRRVLKQYEMSCIFPLRTRCKHVGIIGVHSNQENYYDNPYFIKDIPKTTAWIVDKTIL